MSSNSNITQTTVQNLSENEVTLWLTLGNSSQFVGDVQQVNPKFQENGTPLQGYLNLPPGESISYTPPAGLGFNGNFAFGSPPLNCPPADFLNGINLAEFNLNEQDPNGEEVVDISCVAGTNAYIEISMQGGGQWNAGPALNVSEFSNTVIGKNAGRVGVYPYACTICTGVDNPPFCSNPPIDAPNPPICQKEPICNVGRASSQSGGTVTITFKGHTPPPKG
ncbi:MAG: hypothetical protein H6581_03855 [Bacteroidia bacterium]|nr:hypothetical protein [Bacteroidia bacterium]